MGYLKKVDHLGRKDVTTQAELLYALKEFEEHYRPVGRRKGPPGRYETSMMFNAIRPILVAALPIVKAKTKVGARMVPPIEALIRLLDNQSPFFYEEKYGARLVKPAPKKKGGKLRDEGDDPPPCDIDFSGYWEPTGDID